MGKTTLRVSETTPDHSRKSVAAKQKGNKKTRQEKQRKTPAASRPKKKGLRTSTRRIPKTPGAQNATPEKRQEGRTAKTGKTDKRGGTQKRKGASKTSVCAGVGGGSCYYLIYVSLKKKKNKNGKRRRRKNLRKRERTPKKTRPDVNRIFPNSFGSETPKNQAKT